VIECRGDRSPEASNRIDCKSYFGLGALRERDLRVDLLPIKLMDLVGEYFVHTEGSPVKGHKIRLWWNLSIPAGIGECYKAEASGSLCCRI
jgi:hypothetical protein